MVDYMLSLLTGRPSSRLEYTYLNLRYRSPSNCLEKLQHAPPALNGVILMYQICYEDMIWYIAIFTHTTRMNEDTSTTISNILLISSLNSENQKWHSDGADTQPRAPKSRRLSLLVDCWLRGIICSIPSIHIHHIPSFQLRDQDTVYASIPRYELPGRARARDRCHPMRRFAFTESLKDLDLFEFQIFQIQSSKPNPQWYCISSTTMSLLEKWWTTFELIIPWTISLPRGAIPLVRQLILMEKCLNQNLHVEQAVVETVVETRRRIKLLTSTNYHSNKLVNLRLPMHKIVTTIDLTGIQMMIIMAYHPRFPPVMLRPTQSSQQQTQVSTIYIPGV